LFANAAQGAELGRDERHHCQGLGGAAVKASLDTHVLATQMTLNKQPH